MSNGGRTIRPESARRRRPTVKAMSEYSSPPVEFPVYGLDSWVGPQWIELFGERIGDPVAKVCLAHQTAHGRSSGFAYTLSRAWFDAQPDRHGLDRLAEAAVEPADVIA